MPYSNIASSVHQISKSKSTGISIAHWRCMPSSGSGSPDFGLEIRIDLSTVQTIRRLKE